MRDQNERGNSNSSSITNRPTVSRNGSLSMKKFNTLSSSSFTNRPSPISSSTTDGGVIAKMTIIKKRSLKWCVFIFFFIVSTLSLIPLFYQLPNVLHDTEGVEIKIDSTKNIIRQRSSSSLTTSTTTNIYNKEGWSDVKLLIYMTTHLPPEHIAFLPCWKDAIQRLTIFKYADLMLYTTSYPTHEQLDMLPFRKIIFKLYTNDGYQEGAVQALLDPFQDEPSWFDGYDWVIRLNPDVLIRNDEWLIDTMLNPNIDLIVQKCVKPNHEMNDPYYQTDFFAIRPNMINRTLVFNVDRTYDGKINAEIHFTRFIQPILDDNNTKRYVLVKGAQNEIDHICRIAGIDSPIIHVHEIAQYCPNYYNVTNDIYFR